jgi:5-methylcytosine-specific restriction protein A
MSVLSAWYSIISKKRMRDRGLKAIGPFLMPEMIRMPRRPQTPCKYPGCPRLVPYGRKYCDEHEQQCQGERKNAVLRGYGREWQKARKFFLYNGPVNSDQY